METIGGSVATADAPLPRTGSAPMIVAPAVQIERIAPTDMPAHRVAWSDLVGRALEPNIFLEPAFALPLVQHVAPARRPMFLVAWEAGASSGRRRMVGLLPVRIPRLAAFSCAHGFSDKLACLGTPLLDRDRAREAFGAMMDWLAALSPGPGALVLTAIRAEGDFMRMVVAAPFTAAPVTIDPVTIDPVLADLGERGAVRVLDRHSRAVLRTEGGGVLSLQSAKSRKERKRQRRRLTEAGTRSYTSARSPAAVAEATEAFLSLEQKGWKGRRGTALLGRPDLANFTRTMMGELASEGKARVDALEVNGRAVAMGLVLTSGRFAYFWKTTFEEDFASLSPGVQFTMDLAEVQLGETGTILTDSCARPDHPMIDKLWPHRMQILTIAIPIRRGAALSLALGVERAQRSARAWAKGVRDRAARAPRLIRASGTPI